MKKLIKAELWKLSQGWLLPGILAFMTILCMIFSGQDSPDPVALRAYPIQYLNEAFGKDFQRAEEFFRWYEAYRVRAVIGNSLHPLWCGAIFAAFFIGREFDGRNVNSPLMRGHTRRSYFAAKWLVFFTAGETLSLLTLLLTLTVFVPGWHRQIPGGRLCLYFLLRITADLGTLSLPFLFAFLGRDLIKTVSLSAACAAVLFLVSSDSMKDTVLIRMLLHFPYCALRTVMRDGALTMESLANLLPVSLGLPPFAAAVSYLIFRRLELK